MTESIINRGGGTTTLKPIYFDGKIIGYIPCSESKIERYFVKELCK